MQIRLKKSSGTAVLTFVRADGSATHGRLGDGGFGAIHDLAHYVVETTLGLRAGFYGLLAGGWSIPDFMIKGTSAELPDESIVTECLVSQLTNAFFLGQGARPDEFNWLVAEAVRGVRPAAAAPVIDAERLGAMQSRLAQLVTNWRILPEGDTLTLDWPGA